MRWIYRMLSLALVLCLALGAAPARGDSVFRIDLDALDMSRVGTDAYVQQYLSAPVQTIRVSKYIGAGQESQASVRLTVLRADTKQTVYDKDYGLVYGTFESGDIYLPYAENGSMYYLVTLYLGQWIYALPFLQQMPRLYENGACSAGFRFSEASGGLSGDWLMGTMLDIEGLRQSGGVTQVPLCASNRYLLGYATVTLAEGRYLSVSLALDPNANAELVQYRLFLIADVASVATLSPYEMPQPSAELGQPVDVGDASTVLLYLPMSVSFDPALLGQYAYSASDPYTQYQLSLWETARSQAYPPVEPVWSEPEATLEPTWEPEVTMEPTWEPEMTTEPTQEAGGEALPETGEGAAEEPEL